MKTKKQFLSVDKSIYQRVLGAGARLRPLEEGEQAVHADHTV